MQRVFRRANQKLGRLLQSCIITCEGPRLHKKYRCDNKQVIYMYKHAFRLEEAS